MNMTGDPNERSKPPMFGFGCPYPSTSVDFPRFNNQLPNINPLFSNQSESNSIIPFFPSITVSQNNFVTTPDNLGNNSSPSPSNSGFPFSPQIPASLECSPNIPNTFSSNIYFGGRYNILSVANNAKIEPEHYSVTPVAGTFGCKRKTDSPSIVPIKQHITEERMAEHMSRLHISSQTPLSTQETVPIRERRLYMCEEMQRLQAESIIPAQILEKVYRPCTALVPWRPPLVPVLVKENNNNEEEPDNNRIDNMEMDS